MMGDIKRTTPEEQFILDWLRTFTVTSEFLEDNNCCADGQRWFSAIYSDAHDEFLTSLPSAFCMCNRADWIEWALKKMLKQFLEDYLINSTSHIKPVTPPTFEWIGHYDSGVFGLFTFNVRLLPDGDSWIDVSSDTLPSFRTTTVHLTKRGKP
jgi:hypothetical protein